MLNSMNLTSIILRDPGQPRRGVEGGGIGLLTGPNCFLLETFFHLAVSLMFFRNHIELLYPSHLLINMFFFFLFLSVDTNINKRMSRIILRYIPLEIDCRVGVEIS